MRRKNFIRTREDFVCKHCGYFVQGTGYTNHCPRCLWSEHVDKVPGDRANPCGGLMQPVGLEMKKGKYQIIHRCIKCGEEKKVKADEKDNFNALLALSIR